MLEILKDRKEILKNRRNCINKEVQKYKQMIDNNPDQKEELTIKIDQLSTEMLDTVPRLALYSEQCLENANTKEEVLKFLKTASTPPVSQFLKTSVRIAINKKFVRADEYCDAFFKVVDDEYLFIARLLDIQGEGDVIYQELQTFGSEKILSEISEAAKSDPIKKGIFDVSKFKLFVVGGIAAVGTILYHYFFK